MNTLWQDLRYGLRMLLKNPGFTLVAVVALALGIGANSAIFTPAFFSTLGIKPILGRTLLPGEDQPGKDLSVVISRRLWERRFNSDPNVVGKTVELNGKGFTVVGVIAPPADLPGLSDDTELWAPVSQGLGFTNRLWHYLNVIARLKPGVGREQAQADMDRIAA